MLEDMWALGRSDEEVNIGMVTGNMIALIDGYPHIAKKYLSNKEIRYYRTQASAD